MRIALDARKLNDFGIGRYVRALLRGLPAHASTDGHDLGAICQRHHRLEIERDYPQWQVLPLTAQGYSLREQVVLPVALRRWRADLFHSPHYVVPLYTHCPRIVTVHDCIHLSFPEFLPSPLARSYARMMMRRSVRGAHAVFTVTDFVRRELVRRFAVEESSIVVTPNGVDVPQPEDSPTDLASLGIDRAYVLFVGNPKPHKNLERLLHAFASLDRDDDLLVLVGARLPARLRASISSAAVVELGFVSEPVLWQLYRGARLLALVSQDEGFGLPALEAMAVGTPVLASRVGGLAEVVGDAAVMVEPSDVSSIAGGMQRLLVDARLRRECADKGRQVAARFQWQRTVETTYAGYRRLLQQAAT